MRQLDAEFAEKVLGWTKHVPAHSKGCLSVAEECWLTPDGEHHGRLHPFTLHTAWAGVERLGACSVELYRSRGKWGCIFLQPEKSHVCSEGLFSTPAEALERACLEAATNA